MTPEQIEAAARELCKMRGFQPDELADYPLVPVGLCWQAFASEVRTFAEVGTAIASVMVEPPKKAKRKKGTT